jgi:hypothetical protein
MKPMLKPLATKRLKPEYDDLLSNSASNFNLRRYSKHMQKCEREAARVGKCRETIEMQEGIISRLEAGRPLRTSTRLR